MSLAEADRAAIRAAIARIRRKVELIEYHLDSTETAHDPIEALKEAQRAASQVVTDITLVMERVQARLES